MTKNLSLPKNLKIMLAKYRDMRYGENPHQKSAFYLQDDDPGYEQLWGLQLSHNNLGDANHAWRLINEFDEPTVAIIKHGNPCGLASRYEIEEAFMLAFGADRVSAYGGIIAVNRPPTRQMVEKMRGIFFELLVAPNYSFEVLERLKKRSQRMRVIRATRPPRQLEITGVFNGYLVQTPDVRREPRSKWKVVAGAKPTGQAYDDMEFAWKVVKHVRSNAIVVARDKIMVGMGTGQPNRVNSVKLALLQAKKRASGAILASDAFFPFPDNVHLAAAAGIKVILQPGGSIHDDDVIAAARANKMTMVFTGMRHFKH